MPKKMRALPTVVPGTSTKCGPEFDRRRAEVSEALELLEPGRDPVPTGAVNVKPLYQKEVSNLPPFCGLMQHGQ